MNRRTLLKNAAYTLGGAFLLNNINLGAVTPHEKKLSKIGLQLYTLRKNMERDFEGALQQIAALGIEEVEFAGYFNHPSKEINKLLRNLKLAAPSAHINTQTLRDGLPQAIEDAKIIGHKYLTLGHVPAEERKSLDDYKKVIELLNKAGEECRKAGLQFAYHNHDFEFKETEGKIPYDLILKETDTSTVKIEMDLYWITKAGFSPTAYFEKYPGRFQLVHVKDMDSTPKKSFTEVGRGVIDFRSVLSKAGEAGIKHYFIEQDQTPGEPIESVKISLKYLQALKF